MNAARAFAVAATVVACMLPAQADVPLTGEQILARAKSVFRNHVRPRYVSYTVERRDFEAGEFDLTNSYALRIWCRASDRVALVRSAHHGVGIGPMHEQIIAFDERVDPGPPTADLFERALFGAPTAPAPQLATGPPTIGVVATRVETDYRVTHVARTNDSYDLTLEPKRDPRRNRIDELWVDPATFELQRVRVRDHVYFDMGGSKDEELDVQFVQRDGLPIIASIHGQTEDGGLEVDYRYADVRFADTLPDWYFTPASYGAHRSEAPE